MSALSPKFPRRPATDAGLPVATRSRRVRGRAHAIGGFAGGAKTGRSNKGWELCAFARRNARLEVRRSDLLGAVAQLLRCASMGGPGQRLLPRRGRPVLTNRPSDATRAATGAPHSARQAVTGAMARASLTSSSNESWAPARVSTSHCSGGMRLGSAPEPVQQLRRPLDIGEYQGDDAVRKVAKHPRILAQGQGGRE